ncbi:contractile injection system protein, VgrG/Pvc8 family [Xanthobacter sp. VTT E-85241]|uniref:phage late control D family protein n=1 Tax=Roseixanthobacter finlandensis TaxID=3119922 RepID=UPI00372941D3
MVREPAFRLIYQGKDVTSEFATWPTSITYTDNVDGESDEATVTVHNAGGEWLGPWSPEAGDKFQLWIGYTDLLVPAGTFTVDETSATGDSSGDKVDFKGLAAPKTEALRTPRHKDYEDTSLSDIVSEVAGRHGFSVRGPVQDLPFKRLTQDGLSDTQFLMKLARDYGHFFTFKGPEVLFAGREQLRQQPAVRVIDRIADMGNSLKSYSLRDADHEAAKSAEVKYLHPRRKELVGAESSAESKGLKTASGDVIKLDVRVEDEAQAERIADSHLDTKNAKKLTGTMTLVGDPTLVAGSTVQLTSFGKYDGVWLIKPSRHTSQRSGYETEITIEKKGD